MTWAFWSWQWDEVSVLSPWPRVPWFQLLSPLIGCAFFSFHVLTLQRVEAACIDNFNIIQVWLHTLWKLMDFKLHTFVTKFFNSQMAWIDKSEPNNLLKRKICTVPFYHLCSFLGDFKCVICNAQALFKSTCSPVKLK